VNLYWLEQRESDVPPGNHWLSSAEIRVLQGLQIPKRRADWRLGRWTAKRAIARYLQGSEDAHALAAIEVRASSSGAPESFVNGCGPGISLSISHSNGAGFCALAGAGAQIGCDVEKLAPHSQAFLADYFTTGEQRLVAGTAELQREAVLTLLWSAKESALKALRCGLRADTLCVEVVSFENARFDAGAWSRLAVSESGGRMFPGWWRRTGDFVWTLLGSFLCPLPVAALAQSASVPARLH
jgi:4'-phosphopantetheinyl transferase